MNNEQAFREERDRAWRIISEQEKLIEALYQRIESQTRLVDTLLKPHLEETRQEFVDLGDLGGCPLGCQRDYQSDRYC